LVVILPLALEALLLVALAKVVNLLLAAEEEPEVVEPPHLAVALLVEEQPHLADIVWCIDL